jgi:hypothetical protein
MIKLHKFRFGVNGRYLRALYDRKIRREHRNFPKACEDTWEYVKEYFRLNSQFREGSWLNNQ